MTQVHSVGLWDLHNILDVTHRRCIVILVIDFVNFLAVIVLKFRYHPRIPQDITRPSSGDSYITGQGLQVPAKPRAS